jgi:restriction system protein
MAARLVLVTGGTAALKKWERRKLYDRQTGIDSIRALSWKEFELLIGEAYRRQGYQVIETGGGGAGGGIDLRLKND